jgi:glycosyltransferase involved in cell wall biosynthesis
LLKRLVYHRLLLKSRVLVTYSRESEAYLRALFPQKPVVWLGHFTDTEFFRPGHNREPSKRFFLCVGDHKRHEDVIVKVASAAQVPIIRVSADPRVRQYHAVNTSRWVEVRSGISFEELRRLYDQAEAVLNVVDDSLWPVGITTFCEALAMDKVVVTSGHHSCSGYVFDDGTRPYVTVERSRDVDCWLAAIRCAHDGEVRRTKGRNPRDMAVKYCSFEAAVETWKGVIRLLNERGEDA